MLAIADVEAAKQLRSAAIPMQIAAEQFKYALFRNTYIIVCMIKKGFQQSVIKKILSKENGLNEVLEMLMKDNS